MQEQTNSKLQNAIKAANQSGRFFCKFLSANDTGINGAHQDGIYLAKAAWDIFFPDFPKIPRGNNIDRIIKIHIDGYNPFDSRIVYYGQGTRNEYRITQLWSNSPFDRHLLVGDLIVFIPLSPTDFKIFILSTEEEIDGFIEKFGLSLIKNVAVYHLGVGQDTELNRTIEDMIKEEVDYLQNFPTTLLMAEKARTIYNRYYRIQNINADIHLLKWIETEFRLFKETEIKMYKEYLTAPFDDLDPLITFANTALNRRKSRAGKSLEHHADFIFTDANIKFSHPGRTENDKKPDFILPSNAAYADLTFPTDKLTLLGAKTTCKDRWRQVLNEGDRLPNKHLLTLQQGITANQLDEMQRAGLTLVVPKDYHSLYPKTHQDRLWTVEKFIQYANEKYTI